ncbi:MAG TPA: hypothetical protein VJB98_02260, partial [Candidatus Paceibacterota bacterium]
MDMRIISKDRVGKEYKKPDFKDVTNLRKLVLAIRKVVVDAKKEKIKKVAIVLRDLPDCSRWNLAQGELGEIIARELLITDYEFTKYLSKPKEGWSFITEVAVIGKISKEFKQGIERGKIVAGEVNMTRELSNTPGGDMTPKVLAQAARDAVKNLPSTKVTVLGKKQMEKLGMGAVLGVARGSSHEPQFIVVEYWGAGPASHKATQGDQNNRPIVL